MYVAISKFCEVEEIKRDKRERRKGVKERRREQGKRVGRRKGGRR